MRRALLLPVLLVLPFLPAALAQDAGGKVDQILTRVEENQGATLADEIRNLHALGRGAIDDVRNSLKRANPYVRIAAAGCLYRHDLRSESLEALVQVVGGKDARAQRVGADTLVSLFSGDASLDAAQKRKSADELTARARATEDETARIHLWRAVWRLTETLQPKREIRDILEKTKSREVKGEAALALAEMDSFLRGGEELKELASEPGERGRLARAYLKLKSVQDELNRMLVRSSDKPGPKRDYSKIEEILDLLHSGYYDEAKIDDDKLIEAAARGICSALDPYSAYYDEQMIKELNEEDLGGRYGGIGARVAMHRDTQGNSWLTIVEPIFSGPAYRVGLRSNDQITEIEGMNTVNKDLTDLVKKLRGVPNTKVKFKVFRRGWEKEREFEIAREEIQLETTMHRMLPGKVGYIYLSTFGPQDIEGVRKSIEALKKDGMKALVFDLRGNSGGLLRTAERLADYFLPEGKLIVSTRSRGVEKERRESRGDALTDVPLVVLIDGQSASASEILSGCLQANGRATLVGSRTFGKGSVQDIRPIEATDKKAALRLTIAKWYLPDGKSVEAEDATKPGGVEPDVKVELPLRDFWKDFESERIRATGVIDEYMQGRFAKEKETFYRLAETDANDPARYPEIDALASKVESKVPREDLLELLRGLLREYARKYVQDDQGKPLYFDFQTDVVLQRGILEACKKAGIPISDVPEFSSFAKSESAEPKTAR